MGRPQRTRFPTATPAPAAVAADEAPESSLLVPADLEPRARVEASAAAPPVLTASTAELRAFS
jgi:hypothetical protein